MKTIKLRDFQRNVCSYIKQKGILLVVDKDGVIVGQWLPTGVGHPEGSQKESTNALPDTQLSDKQESPVRHAEESQVYDVEIKSIVYTCDKCKGQKVECYKLWEDGDEKIVCIDCVRMVVPSKMLKSYLRKLQKV